ncbi:hypothetical protein ACROYT_G012801 [Oculina patagonica]
MRMVPIFAITLLLMLSINPEVTSVSGCKIVTNGCSVPGDLPFIYKKTLTPACVKHDVCYTCGEKYGWNQGQCDNAFKRDMYTLCEKKTRKRWFMSSLLPNPSHLFNKVKRCKKYGADLYYTAVRAAGKWYWEKNPPSWCNQSCARNHGDPTKLLEV